MEEIGASDRIKTTEKEEMITLGVIMMKSPAKLALTKGGIIPKNHANRGLGPIPKGHIDREIVHAQGGRIDKVILILRSRDDEDTACVRTDMLAEVQTPSRMEGLTMRPWMR